MAPSGTVSVVAFASVAAAYDPQVGMALARLENAIYCGEERFNNWTVGKQIYTVDPSKTRYIKDSLTKAVAGVGSMTEPDGCFMAIQGTKGTVQSIIDGVAWTERFRRDSCPDCWVHAGWHKSYESIKDDIFQALRDFGCEGRPLYLTGHSLGAAVLHYALYDVVEAGFQVASALAMETPRPGDIAFAAGLQRLVSGLDAYRITHYKDIVPHVPPYSFAHYRHALPEIYYGNRTGTSFQDCGMSDDGTECANQWPLWATTSDDHCWYADHDPCWCGIASATEEAAAFDGNGALVV